MLNYISNNSPEAIKKNINSVDTSHLYLSLKESFQINGKQPIQVNFRDLLPWIKLGDQFTHLIHPYPAKLLPHIANFFINASVLVKKNEIVLDPFSGSGTVALEASLAGCVPHIADANPLALLITSVKNYNYNIEELTATLLDVVGKAKRYRKAPVVDIINSKLWYSDSIKLKLEIILRAIEEIKSQEVKDFFRVCFSATARKLSTADPAISVPVRLKCKPSFSLEKNENILKRLDWLNTVNVIDEFTFVCFNNIGRVNLTNDFNNERRSVNVISDNACDLVRRYEGCERPALIITSPPYGSAQKYIRSSSLSLNWLGFADSKNLTKYEALSIGREHVPLYRKRNIINGLPLKLMHLLDEIKSVNEERFHITSQYLYEMKLALIEMAKVSRAGGHLVIVTGNNSVCGRVLENDAFIKNVLIEAGLKLELHLYDDIKSRGLMTKRNKTASVINKEHILVFSKEVMYGTN